MTLYTIGFSHKSASEFFAMLKEAGVEKVVDVRLKNTSQLAGFTKKDDLEFFLDELAGIDYEHDVTLAPTEALFDAVKKRKGAWSEFAPAFERLLVERGVAQRNRDGYANACLLCSEADPDRCHRRLVAEHLASAWRGVEIVHLT